jgi:hypothetical protein
VPLRDKATAADRMPGTWEGSLVTGVPSGVGSAITDRPEVTRDHLRE